MNWSAWIRQFHRWMSVLFTVCVLANFAVNGLGAPEAVSLGVGFFTLLPLFLLLFSGLYMFALPYFRRAPAA